MNVTNLAAAAGLAALTLTIGMRIHDAAAQEDAPVTYVAPEVFQASGSGIASIAGTVDAYRAALGGINNGNAAGPRGSGRREINWDGGGSTATSPAESPFSGFLINRGALFATPGSGFVQASTTGLAETFANPGYETTFAAFSPVRLFTPVGSNVTEVQFFVPGGGFQAATTRGFGVVFGDVDQPDGGGPGGKRGNRGASTLVEYFGTDGRLIYSGFAPASPGTATLSFLGIVFDDARIASVRITTGSAAPGGDDVGGRDVVVMDDFIYGEPRLVQ